MSKSLIKNPIIWICFGACVLRFTGIGEGLPALYNSTEHMISKYALKMGASQTLDPGFYIYPALLQNIILILYSLVYFTGLITGFYQDAHDFAAQYLVNPSTLILTGRVFSAAVSSVSIVFLYRIVRKIVNIRSALIAAGLMTVSYCLVLFSHFGIHEPLMILFTVFAIDKLWESTRNKNILLLFWAGLFSGLAIASKYNAGFLCAGIIVASFLIESDEIKLKIRRVGVGISGMVLGFFVGNPYMLIAPQRFIAGFQVVSQQMYEGVSPEGGVPILWEAQHLLQYEWLIGITFMIATIYFFGKHKSFYLLSLAVIIPTLIFVSSWEKKGIDYLLVCWPFLIILTAIMLDELYQRYPKYLRLFLILLFSSAALNVMHQVILKIVPDTRSEASRWLLDRIHPDDKVYYDKNGYDLLLVDLNRYRDHSTHSNFLADEIKQKLSEYKHMPRNVSIVQSYIIIEDLLSDSVASDYALQTASVSWKSVEQIIEEGTNWLIINHEYRDIYVGKDNPIPLYLKKRVKDMEEFYSKIEHRFFPVYISRPSYWRAGPTLSIYHLDE